MKEQILHLDRHDDFNSARDKMGWTQTARVLLVWPDKGHVLGRRIDLVLLRRHANRLGAQLALVTDDPIVDEHAREVGLPVFETIEASRSRPWRNRGTRGRLSLARDSAGQDKPRPPFRRPAARTSWLPAAPAWADWILRGMIFSVGAGGLAALALILAPAATITLAPSTRRVQAKVEVVADPAAQAVEGGLIPARGVRVEVQAQAITSTTGLRNVPSDPARGTVIFTSLDGTAALIPLGTGVRTTSGTTARFRTIQAATLEPRIGATAVADVAAIDLGPQGNVDAGLLNAIDGPLGLQLAVTNPAPTAGGAMSPKAAVTSADRARLRTLLEGQLQAAGLAAIQDQLSPGEFLADGSVAIDKVLAATYDFGVGEHADTVQLTLRLAVKGLAISEADARRVAQDALAREVGTSEVLLSGGQEYLREPETSIDPDGRAHFSMAARGAAVPIIDRDGIREAARGQPIDQTRLALTSRLPLSRQPQIEVAPAWMDHLPYLPFRIDVVILTGEG